MRPAAVGAGVEQTLDRAVGESGSGGEALDETFEPPIDDLRSMKPPSSRAPRRSPGPLGMEDARVGEPSPVEAPSSVAHVRVIEINTPPRPSDNTNDQPSRPYGASPHTPATGSDLPGVAHGPAAVSERVATSAAAAYGEDPFPSDEDRFASDDELPHAGPSPEPEQEHAQVPEPEPERVPPAQLLGHGHAHAPDFGFLHEHTDETPRRGFSSVLNARASMRPSPPPPPRSTLGWWLVILLLTGIIAAAGAVAWREHQRELEGAAERDTLEPSPMNQEALAPPTDAPPPAPSAPAEEPTAVTSEPAASTAAEAGAASGPADAGSKARVRVWKPRKVPPTPGTTPPASTPRAPQEAVPANPYAAPRR